MDHKKGKNIEVYTTGCYLCEETMKIINEAKCEECTITERNISKECECGCIQKAKEYGIRTIPTIVIDGKIVIEGKPTVEEINKALGI